MDLNSLVKAQSGWERHLDSWLEPFIRALGRKGRDKWASLYLMGLLLPGERKSIGPISSRVAPDDDPQLNHFIAGSKWDTRPLEDVLCEKVDAMLGGDVEQFVSPAVYQRLLEKRAGVQRA